MLPPLPPHPQLPPPNQSKASLTPNPPKPQNPKNEPRNLLLHGIRPGENRRRQRRHLCQNAPGSRPRHPSHRPRHRVRVSKRPRSRQGISQTWSPRAAGFAGKFLLLYTHTQGFSCGIERLMDTSMAMNRNQQIATARLRIAESDRRLVGGCIRCLWRGIRRRRMFDLLFVCMRACSVVAKLSRLVAGECTCACFLL